jgi:hypothetical protein
MCIIFVRDMISISWGMKNTDCNVAIHYLSPTFTGVQYSCKCDMLPYVAALFKQISLKLKITPWSFIKMDQTMCLLTISCLWSTLAGNILNTVSTERNYSMNSDWRLTINNVTQYGGINGYYLMWVCHLHSGTWPEPLWVDFIRCTRIAPNNLFI